MALCQSQRGSAMYKSRKGIIDKDAAITIGGIIVTVIVVMETVLTQTILGIEVDPAMAETRTRAITRTTKYKRKIKEVQQLVSFFFLQATYLVEVCLNIFWNYKYAECDNDALTLWTGILTSTWLFYHCRADNNRNDTARSSASRNGASHRDLKFIMTLFGVDKSKYGVVTMFTTNNGEVLKLVP
jgi:hypothetical protein